jgi:TRAP transporter TAXI family solute receptor
MKRIFSREIVAAIVLCVGAFWFALHFVKPAPPDHFVIATSSKTSAYYRLALRIQEEAAKKGVKIEVRESAASMDNLSLLKDPDSDVQAGFVQGGLTNSIDAPNLHSMGRLITEPVWIFYRGAEKIDRLAQLKGKRILTGPAGSGTSIPALKMLEANGVTARNSTLISMPLADYPAALEKGTADAGFLVVGEEDGRLQPLLSQPGTRLMNMAQAGGLIQRYPYLNPVTLRQGVIDFAENNPEADASLVATKAALLVRDDLHSALVEVLAQAVLAVQSSPALKANGEAKLFTLGVDALSDDPEFPVPDDARRVYKNGPTFFQRVLPYWVAALVNRAFVLLLPLIGIIFPLIKLVPFIYNWRMKRRILHWYRELKNLEHSLPKTAALGLIEQKEHELARIEEGVQRISVPIHLSADSYELRNHVEFVKRRIHLLREGQARASGQPAPAE